MPNSSNQNSWGEGNAPSQQMPETQKVMAPPVEVAIRTMASDIASTAQSGGGPPRAQSIILPSFNQEERKQEENKESRPAEPKTKIIPEKRGGIFDAPAFKYSLLAGLILVGAAVIFFISYYVLYPLFGGLKSSTPMTIPALTSTPSSVQTGPGFEHHSFFKQAVDGTFPLKISSSNAGFRGSSQQLGQFLVGLSSTSTFFEIQPQSSDDQPLSADKFFSLINGGVLEENFLVSTFNPDFTIFLYKDKNGPPDGRAGLPAGKAGLWPGYILQLKADQTPLLLKSNVAKIESASSNWEDLFLQFPGSPVGTFHDALVSGQPVRVLNFSNAESVLVYGWFFNKYLIISTSLDGLKQAIQHF